MAVEAKSASEVAELLKKLELGLIPDDEMKSFIKIELERRLQWGYKPTHHQQLSQVLNFAHSLRGMSIAMEVSSEDLRFYNTPISFLNIVHGSIIKESCCYFEDDSVTVEEAAVAMMELYCERAKIEDGQRVLDLGCGHGALTMHLARKYNDCRVTGITTSPSHKQFIEDQCLKDNLLNVEIILADITTLEMDQTFDRILAIGLFEHMKNYELLLRKISKWMTSDGFLFVQHMCHTAFPYHFEPLDKADWITNYTCPDGTITMPSAHFLLYFQDDVSIVHHWTISGNHYSHTHEEWLKRMDENANAVEAIMESFLGCKESARKWIRYRRVLHLLAVELFKYRNGEEWMISHVLFKRKTMHANM